MHCVSVVWFLSVTGNPPAVGAHHINPDAKNMSRMEVKKDVVKWFSLNLKSVQKCLGTYLTFAVTWNVAHFCRLGASCSLNFVCVTNSEDSSIKKLGLICPGIWVNHRFVGGVVVVVFC